MCFVMNGEAGPCVRCMFISSLKQEMGTQTYQTSIAWIGIGSKKVAWTPWSIRPTRVWRFTYNMGKTEIFRGLGGNVPLQ